MRRWTELLMTLTVAAAVTACDTTNRRGTDASAPGAQPGGAAGTAGRATDSAATESREFITKTAESGVAEVELGRLAEQKASSPRVKEFANMLVRDHTKANDELKQIAEAKNVQVPAMLEEEHRELQDRLSAVSGREFDREYIKAMVDSHEKAVSRLQQQANADGDPQLKQFASKVLPTVQQHLEQARAIQKQLDQQEGRSEP